MCCKCHVLVVVYIYKVKHALQIEFSNGSTKILLYGRKKTHSGVTTFIVLNT
jgi:hypothetical protein